MLVDDARHPRRDVEPDDLREGDGVGNRLRRAAARGLGGRRVDRRRLLGPRHHRHRARRPTSCARTTTSSDGADGFVSIEVSPDLARDTAATIAQAQELWARLDRPNVMIKIPATAEGVPGDHGDARGGHQRERHLDLRARSLRRGDRRVHRRAWSSARPRGGDISRLASVASFFVSRVDTETDRRLPDGHPLRGKAAVANAKLAYQQFLAELLRPAMGRAGRARARGCSARCGRRRRRRTPRTPPRSTSTRLIGANTVNTLAQASVDVLAAGNGDLRADTVLEDVDEAPGDHGRPRRRRCRLRRRHGDARARGRCRVLGVVPRCARVAREEGPRAHPLVHR